MEIVGTTPETIQLRYTLADRDKISEIFNMVKRLYEDKSLSNLEKCVEILETRIDANKEEINTLRRWQSWCVGYAACVTAALGLAGFFLKK